MSAFGADRRLISKPAFTSKRIARRQGTTRHQSTLVLEKASLKRVAIEVVYLFGSPAVDIGCIALSSAVVAAQSRSTECPLLARSRHGVVHCTCLLLTQSGHAGFSGRRSDPFRSRKQFVQSIFT
jgi:hypothetical protein